MKGLYVGLMEVIFLPSLLFTNSLLMNRPIGWVYFLPLGAVRSRKRSDILSGAVLAKDLWSGSVAGDADLMVDTQLDWNLDEGAELL